MTFGYNDFYLTCTRFFRDIYVSFGGLLMLLRGDPAIAAKFELDQRLFILMRKV